MGYFKWFQAHATQHASIIQKLLSQGLNSQEIITYFRFDHMLEQEPDFCPLYAKKKQCHDMENLNCYFCGCPYFRFDDQGREEKSGKKIYSWCRINSRHGRRLETESAIHQDCTYCLLPHRESTIKKQFDSDWKRIMENVVDKM